MHLIAGPPGSGKTTFVLERLRGALRAGRDDFRLLTPTATMAEHLRNRLAREGLVFRPSLVLTFSKFVNECTPGLRQVPPAILQLIVEGVLDHETPPEFAAVSQFPGFRAAVTGLVSEFSLAGCGPELIGKYSSALAAIYEQVETGLSQRGLVLRSEKLRAAAEAIRETGLAGVAGVLMDGFGSFSDLELSLIQAMAARAEVVITLPDSPGARSTRARLLEMGFSETATKRLRPIAPEVVVAAPTATQEAEEIARRILAQRSEGRPFREIGVVVRSEEPFVPALRSAFDRFGIPSHFYFPEPLSACPPVAFLSGLLQAMFTDWEHEPTLDALHAGLGGDAEFDRFEYAVRDQLPGKGLASLRRLAQGPRVRELLGQLERLDDWRSASEKPAEWAAKAASLASLFSPAPAAIRPEAVELWRTQAWALRQFEASMQEAAAALDPETAVSLAAFWGEAQAVLRLGNLRVPDHRRDVVHVMDVLESRQWELPVVFVCGLLEKQFPKYHAQNPLLSDDVRRRMNRELGLRLRTSVEMQEEERFLFDVAASRATQLLVLSYPRFNSKGDENLRSFFLDGKSVPETPVPVRPRPRSEPVVLRRSVLAGDEVLAAVARIHGHFGPTGIEIFLNCPFQFFSEKTLRLAPPPARPGERLDSLLKGSIVHSAIQSWHVAGGDIAELLDELFDTKIEEKRVPRGFRTEFERLTMRRVLERFAADPHLLDGWTLHQERKFELLLREDVKLRGRIDRIEVSPDGEAVVLDYKYSGAKKLDELIDGHQDGTVIQAGIYLLAAVRLDGCRPAGMFYWSLKAKDRAVRGWRTVGVPELGPSITLAQDLMDETLERAAQIALDAVDAIRSGRIEATPSQEPCGRCDYFDVCRKRAAALELAAGGDE